MKKILILMVCMMASIGILQAQGQAKGYRGFTELCYCISIGDYNFRRVPIETSHGYQFKMLSNEFIVKYFCGFLCN